MGEWSNWESGDSVGSPNWPHGSLLDQHEILRRVAVAFRRVIIDWSEGDRWAEERIRKGIEIGYRGVLLQNEQALRGQSVLVSFADSAGPNAAWVRFYMIPNTEDLELHYEEQSGYEPSCRQLAVKLAEMLGYNFSTCGVPLPDSAQSGDAQYH